MENLDKKLDKISIIEVEFELPSAKNEAGMLMYFCYNPKSNILDWSETVYKYHPKLKEIVAGIKDKDEFYNKCYEYVENYIKENHKEIKKARDSFEKSWNEVGGKFFQNILKDFDINLSGEIKKIKAIVSINPICPRNIDKWSYNLFYKSPSSRMREISIHEIIHFLHFKKWLEIFPDYDKKTFNSPYSEWVLSEILVIPIMNNNKTIQEIVKNSNFNVYNEWQSIKIMGKSLPEYFGEIYKEHLEKKAAFDDFIKKSWEEYNKHKDVIESGMKKF